MKCKCKLPLYKQLLKSNRKCDYYTGNGEVKKFHRLDQMIRKFRVITRKLERGR